MFDKKLYYGCLSAISVNHYASNCKKRKERKVCKKRHPTSLDGYKAFKSKAKQSYSSSSDESIVNVKCARANTKSDVISMCLVPVLVRHKLSNRFVKMYTMLDNCNQAAFMRNKL